MDLTKLLSRQSRPEVGIALADALDGRRAEVVGQLPIAWLAASLRRERNGA
jgi:hypothetical protein